MKHCFLVCLRPALIFSLSLAFLLSNLRAPVDPYDEGIVLTGSWLVSLGWLPYRDFWTIYSPGQYFIVGSLFRLFGPELMVERLWDLLVRAGICLAAFEIVRHRAGTIWAGGLWLALLLWLERFGRFGYSIFPALLLIFLFILALQRSRSSQAAVLAAGAAAWFRHDFLLYLIVSLGVFLGSDYRRFVRMAVAICLFAAIPYLLLAPFAGSTAMFEQLIRFPLIDFPAVMARQFPFPQALQDLRLSELPLYLPLLVPLVYIYALGREVLKDRFLRLLLAMSLVLLNQARVRSDFPHLFPAFTFSLVLLFLAAHSSFGRRSLRAVAVMAFTVLALIPLFSVALKSKLVQSGGEYASRKLLVSRAAEREFELVISRLQTCANGLYVALPRNDTPVRSDMAIYFASGRKPAARFFEPHPGWFDRRDVQESIIKELEDNRLECVVASDPYGEYARLDDRPREVSALDFYLSGKFEHELQGRYYSLLRRRD